MPQAYPNTGNTRPRRHFTIAEHASGRQFRVGSVWFAPSRKILFNFAADNQMANELLQPRATPWELGPPKPSPALPRNFKMPLDPEPLMNVLFGICSPFYAARGTNS